MVSWAVVAVIVLLILLVVVGLFLYLVYRGTTFTPPITTSTSQIKTGRFFHMINSARYTAKQPAYLGFSAGQFRWLTTPDATALWTWDENQGECFNLNATGYCANNYLTGTTYNCGLCNMPDKATNYGPYFCGYCASGNDLNPYTSLSLQNNFAKAFLYMPVKCGYNPPYPVPQAGYCSQPADCAGFQWGQPIDCCDNRCVTKGFGWETCTAYCADHPAACDTSLPITCQVLGGAQLREQDPDTNGPPRVWMDVGEPANATSGFTLSVRIRNIPPSNGVPYYLGNTVVPIYGWLNMTTIRDDNSLYYIDFSTNQASYGAVPPNNCPT
jgi:hypothetical protein